MTATQETENQCTIVVAELFALINRQRKLYNLTPIEDSALATRCTLRANVDKQRGLDFSQPEVAFDAGDAVILENILNEQFAIHLDGDLERLCKKPEAPAARPATPPPSHTETPAPEPRDETSGGGLGSRLKGLFGRR